ncbi:hypothetical protein ACFQ9X_03360 [Catenulispora yoronensis]
MTPPRRVGVPPLSLGGQAVAERLDRHFAAIVDAPAARATTTPPRPWRP